METPDCRYSATCPLPPLYEPQSVDDLRDAMRLHDVVRCDGSLMYGLMGYYPHLHETVTLNGGAAWRVHAAQYTETTWIEHIGPPRRREPPTASAPTDAGHRRVMLVGGHRHGQWHNVPAALPPDIRVLWPPSVMSRRVLVLERDADVVLDVRSGPTLPVDDYVRVQVAPLDYVRVRVALLNSYGAASLGYCYAVPALVGDVRAIKSAYHVGQCLWMDPPRCSRPDLHEPLPSLESR